MNLKIIPVGQYGHFMDIDAIIEAAKGLPGESAYQLAVKNGFKGTEKEWLEACKGKSHIDIADYEIKAHTVFDDGTNVKVTPLVLSKLLKDTALTNIGAAPIENTVEAFPTQLVANAAEEGLTAVRFVELQLSAEQKAIAQLNINVADESRVRTLELKVGRIDVMTTGNLKYIGPIEAEEGLVSLADLSPVKKGYIYNVIGDTAVVNGFTIHGGMWVMATKDTEPEEEPVFILFCN